MWKRTRLFLPFLILALGGLFQAISAYDITTGMVGKWSFEGNANDSSGQGNHGTPVNSPAYGAGNMGSALLPAANGASPRYANVGHNPSLTNISNQWTVAAWVKYTGPNGMGAARSTIISRFSPANIFLLDVTDSPYYLRCILYTNGGSWNQSSATPFPVNQWVHVAAVYNGATVTVYTNGQVNFSGAATGNLVSSATADVLIGARGDVAANYVWNGGGLDEVCMWSRALAPGDVAALAAGIPAVALTNITNGQVAMVGTVLHGTHLSPAGIKTTRLFVSNGGGEVTNMPVIFDSGSAWHADPALYLGTYTAVLVTTNSNDLGSSSAPVSFTLTKFSTLTVRTTRADGISSEGGILFGPCVMAYDGLRTNNVSGEAVWANVQAGMMVGITNFTATRWGLSATGTNFTMPGADTTVTWNLDPPANGVGSPSTPSNFNAAYFIGGRDRLFHLKVRNPGGGVPWVVVNLQPLRGGGSLKIYEGYGVGETLSLDIPLDPYSRFLTPGPWIVETRLTAIDQDEKSAGVTRQMVLMAR